ncbi:carboxypeptidase-like regulatory domain-containing protein [Flavobacterium psychrotrophum]|uniref:carboxypeptidase-like regulatory domain-containing protein n=1 Tax=Flavobacterium psychrotrophum TaxID=2294119 RepID=UPI000E3223FB|nr:carboxypeptidase-like regulatory domain-containing protein [Flavobacterium psychrotrophum]
MKLNTFLLIFLICCCHQAFAQTGIYDSKTRQPIAYAHVLVKSRAFGTSTNEQGKFPLRGVKEQDTLTISATHYAVKKIAYTKQLDSIFLNNNATLHPAVQLESRKGSTVKESFLLTGDEMSEPGLLFEVNDQITGQYFAPRPLYKDNPYLQGLSVKVFSTRKKQCLNVIIRAVGKDGKPGDYVYDKNILCEIKEDGPHTVRIDLAKLKIQLPPDGFFISFAKVVRKRSDAKSLVYVSTALNPVRGNPKYSAYTVRADDSGFKWIDYKNYTVMIELELGN